MSLILLGMLPTVARSQVIPDASLPENTSVQLQGETFRVEGGSQVGDNLFHSFESFSIPTGSEVWFNQDTAVANIISRITGASLSEIDGNIRANGTAHVFLINPNGIVFGPNAQLNVGGSFLATTATGLKFTDGTFFSTSQSDLPLLTVHLPNQIVFEGNTQPIAVQGIGNTTILAGEVFSPINVNRNGINLQGNPDQTFALIGGDLSFQGGLITTSAGKIELGAVESGLVEFDLAQPGWEVDYQAVTAFKNVELSESSVIDVLDGSINIRAQDITLADGSVLITQQQSPSSSGDIHIQAAGTIDISGINQITPTFILSETFTEGTGNSILLEAQQLKVRLGGGVVSRTFSGAPAGSIDVRISETVEVIDALGIFSPSSIASQSLGSGSAGNVRVTTTDLSIINGGQIASSTFGPGSTGAVQINASESILIQGVTEGAPDLGSLLGTNSLGVFAAGNAGPTTLSTKKLRVLDGGIISTSTQAAGSGGPLKITASEFIEIRGRAPAASSPSSVGASSAPAAREFLPDPSLDPLDFLTGDSGTVEITTPQLIVNDGAELSAANQGTGNAGRLRIDAAQIKIDTDARISTETASGEGGDIQVNSQGLTLRNGGSLTTSAGGSGNGGDIEINSPLIVAIPSENSDIRASALEGSGGNIRITSEAVVGIAPQNTPTNESDITASSELGVDGTVQINSPAQDSEVQVLLSTHDETISALDLAKADCRPGTISPNQFTLEERRNWLADPTEFLTPPTALIDLPDPVSVDSVSTQPAAETAQPLPTQIVAPTPLQEANRWQVNEAGQIVLVAQSLAQAQPLPDCQKLQDLQQSHALN
ncbi:MAG: filamentous hemagglutinin N-terminal domain-containing protein [Synechococcaceae cyanobacterium SM2_3_1]|nr:filamentous hemagglutinin N-terminal domain-containing protein [Synechococcaceae cyanobacterium SM2_3_1]